MALEHEFMVLPSECTSHLQTFQLEYLRLQTGTDIVRYSYEEQMPKETVVQEQISSSAMEYLTKYYKMLRHQAVCVKDKYILGNLNHLKSVHTFMDGCVPYYGLCYYGFTVMYRENVQQFMEVLYRIQKRHCFSSLIALCKEAYLADCFILHCGI